MKRTNVDQSFARRRGDEEVVRELLQAAGRRESVPGEDLTAIKRTALPAWNEAVVSRQRRVRRTHRRTALAVAASLTLAMLLVFWWSQSGSPSTSTVATAEIVSGEVRAAGISEALAPGADLSVGTALETPAAGRIALRLDSGHSARLDVDTAIELGVDELRLRRGAVYVDSGGSARPIRVATDWGVVREIGTQFEVRVDGPSAALRVRVREGEVGVQAGASVQTLVPGEELVIDRYGGGTRNTIPLHGDGWDWLLEVAPAPDVDGQRLRVFLAWFRRETGLIPRYADPELASTVPEIEIHGSIHGMTPFDALKVVMAGSDLAYRVEGGDLVIERPANGSG